MTPLVQSIRDNTAGDYRIWFICTPGDYDEMRAIEAEGLDFLVLREKAGRANFAKKINYAFDLTDDEWVFQGADDLRFGPSWDVRALATAKKTRAGVIGTNDMHNPAVRRGRHSTHTLIRRSYIERFGGTFDNSGRVFSEVYDHQYTDNEFIETARQRGQWAFSRNSIVEHLHPHWGNAKTDATYRKALRQSNADRQLFMERMGVIGKRRPKRYSSHR